MKLSPLALSFPTVRTLWRTLSLDPKTQFLSPSLESYSSLRVHIGPSSSLKPSLHTPPGAEYSFLWRCTAGIWTGPGSSYNALSDGLSCVQLDTYFVYRHWTEGTVSYGLGNKALCGNNGLWSQSYVGLNPSVSPSDPGKLSWISLRLLNIMSAFFIEVPQVTVW